MLGLGWPQILRAASLHAGFFAVSGALALAWLAGFATPGAPAGVGVREAILILALTGSLGDEASTLVALAFRLVTTGGDVLLFALGAALPLPADPPSFSHRAAPPELSGPCRPHWHRAPRADRY
jgi:hypothetical protein